MTFAPLHKIGAAVGGVGDSVGTAVGSAEVGVAVGSAVVGVVVGGVVVVVRGSGARYWPEWTPPIFLFKSVRLWLSLWGGK